MTPIDARTKRLTLLACILGSTIVMVDGSAVTVALPQIREQLGGGLAGQQWTANAYLLTLGSLLMVAGSLGDVFGERRIFLLGVIGFGVTSVLCALAPTIEVLVVGRALQGVAGALLTPAALAVIVSTFGPDERSRAIGRWTAWAGLGAAGGPLRGGWLVDVASWHWIFLINVPLVLLTAWLIVRVVPAGSGRRMRRLDLLGAALCAVGLGGVTFALIQQPLSGWGAPTVLGGLLGGAAILVAFVLHERRTSDPMLPLKLFRRRNFVAGNVETLLVYAGLALVTFYLVIFLQQTAGWDALEAGATMLPVTIVMLVAAGWFGGLADRHGPRWFMGVGPLISGAGLLLLLRVDADVDYLTDLLPAITLFGLGLAVTVAPLTATVLADADRDNAGAASGVNNAIARIAGLLGIAAVGVAVAGSFASGVDERVAGTELSASARAAVAEVRDSPFAAPDLDGVPAADAAVVAAAARDAAVEGHRLAMAGAAALLLLGGAIGLAGIRNPPRTTRAETPRAPTPAGPPTGPETTMP